MSNSRQEASSEPVAKASPLGKNLVDRIQKQRRQRQQLDALNGVNIGLVTSEGLRSATTAYIPELRGGITSTRDKDILVWAKR